MAINLDDIIRLPMPIGTRAMPEVLPFRNGTPIDIEMLSGLGGGLPLPEEAPRGAGGGMPSFAPPAPPAPPQEQPMLPPIPPQMQRQPEPEMGGRDLVMQLIPLVMAAFQGRKDPRSAAALLRGVAGGQEMARKEQLDARQRDDEKRQLQAKWMQSVASDAAQFTDPVEHQRYLDFAEQVSESMGLPRGWTRSIAFPKSKAVAAKKAKAEAKEKALRARFGEQFDTDGVQNATITGDPDFDGMKVRDVVALAGLHLTDAAGKTVAPSVMADEQTIDQAILSADKRGDQAEVARLLDLKRRMSGQGRAPKSLQRTEVYFRGRRVLANYDPATGTYTDTQGNALPDAQPLPEKPTASSGAAGGMGSIDADAIAEAIIRGEQPPDLKGLYRYGAAVKTSLARKGYNLSQATTDWVATQRHFSTLNGPQQTRIRQAADTAYHSLDVIADLADQWKGGRFPLLNRASLAAAKGGAMGTQAQQIATQLEAQITDVASELANVYMGGNSPTDHALKLAQKNLSADWSLPQLLSAVELARKNLQIRLNAIANTDVLGVSESNPYGRPNPGGGGTNVGTAPPKPQGANVKWSKSLNAWVEVTGTTPDGKPIVKVVK